MEITFIIETFVGARTYAVGETASLSDHVAKQLITHKRATENPEEGHDFKAELLGNTSLNETLETASLKTVTVKPAAKPAKPKGK
jgi:hypothetical protein